MDERAQARQLPLVDKSGRFARLVSGPAVMGEERTCPWSRSSDGEQLIRMLIESALRRLPGVSTPILVDHIEVSTRQSATLL
jgi:hypothetical protein